MSNDCSALLSNSGKKIIISKICPTSGVLDVASKSVFAAPDALCTTAGGKLAAFVTQGPNGQTINVVKPESGSFTDAVSPFPAPKGGFGTVVRLAISDSGRFLAACDQTGQIYSCKLPISPSDPDPRWKFLDVKDSSRIVWQFLREAPILVAGGSDGRVHAWDCDASRRIGRLCLGTPITSLQGRMCADAELIVGTGCSTDPKPRQVLQLHLLSAPGGQMDIQIRHKWALPIVGEIASAELSSDGRRLYTGSSGGAVHLWGIVQDTVALWETVRTPNGTPHVWLLTDDRTVLRLSYAQLIGPWRAAATGRQSLPIASGSARPFAIDKPNHEHPGRIFLSTPSDPKSVRAFSFASKLESPPTESSPLAGLTAEVTAIEVISDLGAQNKTAAENALSLLVATADGKAILVNPENRQTRAEVFVGESVQCFAKGVDSKNPVVAAGSDHALYSILEFSNSALQPLIDQHRWTTLSRAVHGLAYLPDKASLAIGFADGSIMLRELGPRKTFGKPRQGFSPLDRLVEADTVADPNYHSGYVSSVAWNNDGSLVATASADGCVRTWGVADGKLKDCLLIKSDEIISDQAKVKEALNKEPWVLSRERWKSPDGPTWDYNVIYSTTFRHSGGNEWVMAQPFDMRIAYWSHSQSGLASPPAGSPKLLSLSLNADHTSMATGSAGGTVVFWKFDSGGAPVTDGEPLLVGPSDVPVFTTAFAPGTPDRLAAMTSQGVLALFQKQGSPLDASRFVHDPEHRIQHQFFQPRVECSGNQAYRDGSSETD